MRRWWIDVVAWRDGVQVCPVEVGLMGWPGELMGDLGKWGLMGWPEEVGVDGVSWRAGG